MKHITHFICLLSISMLLFSCASQNHLELVGHYKPNTEVTKLQSAQSPKSDNELQKISSADNQQLSASAEESKPEVKSLMETIQQANQSSAINKMSSANVEKLEKKLNKLADKKLMSKPEAQLGKSSANRNKESSGAVSKVLLIILCFLLPPLAVGLAKGIGWPFWLSLILTLCFWIPGVIYALIVILGD